MYNKNRLFIASALSLFVTAVAFGARSGHLVPWMNEFGLSAAEVGWIASGVQAAICNANKQGC
jgi:hypothetical protein